MKDATPFQIAVIGGFAFMAVVGVFFLATFSINSTPEEERIGPVSIWGTYDARVINDWIQTMAEVDKNLSQIRYYEIARDEFDRELLEALAEQRGPDVLLLDNSQVYEQRNRIFKLTGDTLARSDFRTTFVQMTEAYETPQGILGLPLFSNPLVLFWNRTIFQSASLVAPPVSWQEYSLLVPQFTQTQGNLVVTKSALPFGETANIMNGKELVWALSLQSGNPLSFFNEDGDATALLAGADGGAIPSLAQAADFFLSFSNPSSPLYSWNRSLPPAQDYFVSGNAATYVGFASEIRTVQQKNPNLNFDIAELPQSSTGTSKSTYADLYGLFLTNGSLNKAGAYRAMTTLTSRNSLTQLQERLNLGLVRRDMASQVSGDELFTNIFARSSIYGATVIDPSDVLSDQIYTSMLQKIASGQRNATQAISVANQEIQTLYNE